MQKNTEKTEQSDLTQVTFARDLGLFDASVRREVKKKRTLYSRYGTRTYTVLWPYRERISI